MLGSTGNSELLLWPVANLRINSRETKSKNETRLFLRFWASGFTFLWIQRLLIEAWENQSVSAYIL